MGRPGGSHSPYIIMDIGESIKSGTRISAARLKGRAFIDN